MKIIAQLFDKIYHDDKKIVFSLFLSSLIFSIFFLIFLRNIGPSGHQTPNTDYLVRYQPIAENILAGKGITLDGQVHPEWAPGFSVILAGLFAWSDFFNIDRLDSIVFLNIIIAGISACLLFFFAREFFDKKVAVISSVLWMTYPFNLWFLKNPNSEVPFLAILYLGILFLAISIKKNSFKFIFLSGFFFGLASLVRLPALFFSIFLAILIVFIFRKISLKRRCIFALLILAGNFLTFLPWGIYSSAHKNGSVPIGYLSSEGIIVGYTFLLGSDSGGEKLPFSPETRKALAELKNSATQDSNALVVLWESFKKYPKIFTHLTILRIFRAWYATGMMWWEKQILFIQIFYILSAILGMLFYIKNNKNKIIDIILALGIIIYFWAMSSLAIPILRYLIPAMPIVVVFSAVFIDFLLKKYNIYGKINFRNHSLPQ